MLVLRLLSKVLVCTKSICHPPGVHRSLWWGSVSGNRVRPAEFIRPKQINIWLYEGRVLLHLGMRGKMALVLEPYNSVSVPDSAKRRWTSAGWGCRESEGWCSRSNQRVWS